MLWHKDNFIEKLQHNILHALPGIDAQLQMAPPSRGEQLVAPTNAKKGGVIIVLYKKNKEWHTLLMKRTLDGGTHSGQISLPGGKYDLQDQTITYTAIRELEEEMGIGMHQIKILGNLTPLYIPPSNFNITPIVCYWHSHFILQPSPQEVQEIIEVPLHQLFDTATKQYGEVYRSDFKNMVMTAPLYQLENKKIWGATAMVLSELEHLLLRN